MGTLLAVLGSFVSKLLADEFKAWTPWLTRRLIDRSALKLPLELQERYREEWSSHVEEVPGQVGKLLVAAGFLTAARGIRLSHTVPDLSPSPANLWPVAGAGGALGIVLRELGDQPRGNDMPCSTYRRSAPSTQTTQHQRSNQKLPISPSEAADAVTDTKQGVYLPCSEAAARDAPR